jgi:4-hydroxybenzoate polyprenyltransferase
VSPAAVIPLLLLGLAVAANLALRREPADRSAGRSSWAVRVGPLHARKQSMLLTALGILAAPLVLPAETSTDRLALVELPAMAIVAFNAMTWRSADPQAPSVRGFVLRNVAAAVLAIASWCALLLWAD